ncbi:MAG TPA: LPD7 domain-containing protein [Roseateles sp.]
MHETTGTHHAGGPAAGGVAPGQPAMRFTESTFRLATESDRREVAATMVGVAQARGWAGLRVTGSLAFRAAVWHEAALRGMRMVGYAPGPADLQRLRQDVRVRAGGAGGNGRQTVGGAGNGTEGSRGSGGRKTVIAAIDAVLLARRVPQARRRAVLDAATEQLAQRLREGRVPVVRIYDRNAPSRSSVMAPGMGLAREPAEPVQGR